ncbi:MAG: hypothetical protein A2Y40_03010 [Candidatus Margulisbacteria bacterium GWF2_35_9]|nr:MAG: hypothetical protein A2Y40_03010 [Candidatus Margulisbacteria bacterium GWF2_35_9]
MDNLKKASINLYNVGNFTTKKLGEETMNIETTNEKKVYTEESFYKVVKTNDRKPNTYDQFIDRLLDEIYVD